MNIKIDNITKDFLFVAILLSFLAYKFPTYPKLADDNVPTLNLIQYKQREALMLNSILESGVQLLDIKMELDNSTLRRASDLVATIRFDSFGNVPTLINLDYLISDSSGAEVYRELDEVTVETEKVVTKDFKKLNLKPGEYVLTLTTLYNTDVSDEFKQQFVIKGPSALEIVSWIVLVLAALGVGGSLIYKLIQASQN